MQNRLAVVLVSLLLVPACEHVPLEPDGANAPAYDSAPGRAGESVTVPVQVRATLFWIVDQSAQALAACAPRPGLAVGSGEGEATHLGRFTVELANHCSVDLAANPPLLDASGPFEWRAADGSTISGHYEFLFLPPEAGGFFTMYVEGGTGRFAGAEGQLELDAVRSGVVQCVDPLCLNGATLAAVVTGSISIPRP